MKKYAILMMVFSVLIVSGCKQPNFQPIVVLSEVLPTFPASMSSQTRGISPRETTAPEVIDYIGYVYAPVRETYNPLADQALAYINELFSTLDSDVFDSYYIMRDLNDKGICKGTSADQSEKYFITKVDNAYTVQLWKLVDRVWVKTLHLTLTKSESDYSGTAYARAASVSSDRTEYRLDFNTADPDYSQVVEISAINIEPDDAAEEEIPRKLWLKAWEKDSAFFIAANVFYIRVNIEENSPYRTQFMALLEGDDPDNIKGSYMYTAAVSLAAEGTEYAGANLALVGESVTDNTAIFTDNSVGALYKEGIAAWLRTDPDNSSGGKIVTDINAILVNGGQSAYVIADPATATTADIFTALRKTKDLLDLSATANAELDAVLFVVKLVNPGYYDATGFIGTEELDKPDWAAQVPAFPEESAISPTAADIAADTFTVTMPQDTEPNF